MATDQTGEVLLHLRRAVLLADGAGLTDGQLLEGFVSRRDQAALAALVHRHGPMVWGVCRRVLRDHHDAEDAFQATFLVLVRKAASVVPREVVANWLYGVAYRTALKARATAARRKGRERQVTEMPEPEAVRQDLCGDLQPLLDEELSRLPDKYRAVLVLCDLEGKTRKEAARQLGVPEGTVAGRLARARALLAKRLAQRGVTLSGAALAAVLSQEAAAGVPAAVMLSTIKAAGLFAAGRAATGVISAKAVALTEGVLKSMFLTKLKTVVAVVLVVGLVAVPAAGLAYRAMAGEPSRTGGQARGQGDEQRAGGNPNSRQPWVDVGGGLLLPAGAATPSEGPTAQQLRAEVERLRADNEELKRRLQQQVRKEKAGEVKLVVKVYPVATLIEDAELGGELLDQLNPKVFPAVATSLIDAALKVPAEPLKRVITKTIEPASWYDMGGDGSIEYLPAARSLVIRQTPDIQRQVQELLDALGKAKAESEKAEQGKAGM
jgi:RNA polymerase sigma factor (sigma-70 family)